MTKIKLLSIAVIFLVALNVALAFFLFSNIKKLEHGRGSAELPIGPKMIIIKKLKFDKEQIVSYEALIKKHRITIKSLNDSISATKKELYQSLQDKDFKGKDSLIHKISLLQQNIEETHYAHFLDIRNLCKPSQYDDFNQLTKELANYFKSQRKVLNL